MSELCLLGTASGLPTPRRFGQTAVLTIGEAAAAGHYLLDVGDGASSLLARAGFDQRHLRAIFVSHMDGDHHAGVVQVVKTCMHLGKTDELLILAPAEGIAPLRTLLEASYLFPEWLGFPLRWVSLAEAVGQPVRLGPEVTLTPYTNSHLAPARARLATLREPPRHPPTFESYSAVVTIGNRRLVYSGNLHGRTGAEEMAGYVEPCALLLCELAHVDPRELGRFLAAREVAHTVVAHVHPKWDAVPDAEILALIADAAGEQRVRGRVSVAHDGDRFAIGNDTDERGGGDAATGRGADHP